MVQETKRLLRGDFAREWADYCEEEAGIAWRMLASPEVVGQLGSVLERLSARKQQSKL